MGVEIRTKEENRARVEGNAKIHSKHKVILLIAAFAAVYIIWGSTYLAIKYLIQTLPSLVSMGMRFLLAGGAVFIIGRFSRDYKTPSFAQWRANAIIGVLLFLGGIGGVVMAEHYLTSGFAALLVAIEPFWVVLLSWLWLKQARPDWKVSLGLLIGFAGVYLLIGGAIGNGSHTSGQPLGMAMLMAGTLCWAVGSLYGSRAPSPESSFVAAGMQMLTGGMALFLAGTLMGEWRSFDIASVSFKSWLALAYLVIFGSLIAFTAYSWLLKNVRPAIVATYAYINPVIAVTLGWAIAGESFTGRMAIGSVVIIASVVLITSRKSKARRKEGELSSLIENPAEIRPPFLGRRAGEFVNCD